MIFSLFFAWRSVFEHRGVLQLILIVGVVGFDIPTGSQYFRQMFVLLEIKFYVRHLCYLMFVLQESLIGHLCVQVQRVC